MLTYRSIALLGALTLAGCQEAPAEQAHKATAEPHQMAQLEEEAPAAAAAGAGEQDLAEGERPVRMDELEEIASGPPADFLDSCFAAWETISRTSVLVDRYPARVGDLAHQLVFPEWEAEGDGGFFLRGTLVDQMTKKETPFAASIMPIKGRQLEGCGPSAVVFRRLVIGDRELTPDEIFREVTAIARAIAR